MKKKDHLRVFLFRFFCVCVFCFSPFSSRIPVQQTCVNFNDRKSWNFQEQRAHGLFNENPNESVLKTKSKGRKQKLR